MHETGTPRVRNLIFGAISPTHLPRRHSNPNGIAQELLIASNTPDHRKPCILWSLDPRSCSLGSYLITGVGVILRHDGKHIYYLLLDDTRIDFDDSERLLTFHLIVGRWPDPSLPPNP